MQNRKLKIKKEIVANLSDTESSQFRGGRRDTFELFGGCVTGMGGCSGTDLQCCSNIGCPTGDSCACNATQCAGTSCCGPTYADCTYLDCKK